MIDEKHRDRFEHHLAELVSENDPEISYEEARRRIAESEGAAIYEARRVQMNRQREMNRPRLLRPLFRVLRWAGLD